MIWPGAFFHRYTPKVRKPREESLDQELRFHLEEATRDNIAAGMNPDEARRAAALEFGGLDQIKEECRDVAPWAWLDALWQDVKFSLRSLGKSKGFTLTALATLAIGIGFNAAIYSYLDGILFRTGGYPEDDRGAWIYESGPAPQRLVSTENFLDLVEQNTVFQYLAAHRWGTVTLTGAGLPTQVYCERVGIHFYDIYKTPPALGRLFLPGDDVEGHHRVVVINHVFWQSQFAGDPNIVGRPVTLDGEVYTIIGVLPKGITDLTPAKMWRPLVFSDQERNRENRWLLVWGKLKPGITPEQARAEVATIAGRLVQDHPSENKGWALHMEMWGPSYVPPAVKQSLYLLMASVGMVLLIACTNLANLTLARGAVREREIAVRAALGASRWRLARQLLAESLLLAAGGSILGIGVAYGSLAWLNRLVPSYYIPINKYVEMDHRVLLFILGLAALTGLVFGLYPALKGSRPDLRHSLSQGGLNSSRGRLHQRLRSTLVVGEVALAIVLLFGSGLLIRSFAKLKQVDTGFNSADVITADLPINTRHFTSDADLNTYLGKITDRMMALPGVRDVALTSMLPTRGFGFGFQFKVGGRSETMPSAPPVCYFKTVSPSYFRLLSLRLLRGRLLGDHDLAGTAPVAVINETMAKRHFAESDPIGQTILLPRISFFSVDPSEPREVAWEIVGVVADELLVSLGAVDSSAGVYVSTAQCPVPMQSLLVRTAMDPAPVQRVIPTAMLDVNPDQPVQDLKLLEQIKSESVGKQRLDSTVLSVFGGVALLLSALGLYGVISYSVAQRTREIGIRGALGATPRAILWLAFRSGLLLTGVGLILGLVAAVGAGRILGSMLFQVDPFDALTLGAIVAIQVIVALLACFLPARRALKVSPLVALRCE